MRKLVVEDFAMEYTMILCVARLYLAEDTNTEQQDSGSETRYRTIYCTMAQNGAICHVKQNVNIALLDTVNISGRLWCAWGSSKRRLAWMNGMINS